MISEIRVLCHFILVLLSSTLVKQLTSHVGIISLVFSVWIFSWHDLLQVIGTDSSCVLYIICSQFIKFEQVTLYSANCACFVALLASPYAVLLRTAFARPYLFLAQSVNVVYNRIQFELKIPVQS